MSDQPFQLDCDERACLLLIDGSWLDAPEPIKVNDDYGPVRLGKDPFVRVTLDREEATQLWRLLDLQIGEHQREGEVVREAFDRTKREGYDTAIPSREAYLEAKDEILNPHMSEENRAEAHQVIVVYERAHGMEGS